MIRSTLSPFVLALLILAGCASEEAPQAESEEAPTEAAMTAPSADNPLGNEEGALPPGWEWRFDRGSDFTIGASDTLDTWFVTMTPGWHLTTRPAGIFYHPASVGQGDFTASATIHLFDPGERNEGYGIILGGSDLQGDGQEYLYFLLRRSGEFLVKLRSGSETDELIGWTEHPAVVAWTEEAESTITNSLSVTVGGEIISFMVNDEEVATLEKADLPTDGVVGLRMNHGINVHVSDLAVTPAA
ncbi:MAG: hypothetical protein HKN29_14770 [Rhodothermales bacterium]|nr:hypothetical protein [Rhodothermales bacterium]